MRNTKMRCTTMIKLAELDKFICDYIKANWRNSMNEPVGTLKYKFLDPAADYRGQLWDWDSFFCGMTLIDVYDDTADYLEGCVRNFIDNVPGLLLNMMFMQFFNYYNVNTFVSLIIVMKLFGWLGLASTLRNNIIIISYLSIFIAI